MSADGGIRAISGFLFQVLVGGGLRAAGECEDLNASPLDELAALIRLARTGRVIHEFADQDLVLRQDVIDPANAASAEITLVQVKFSVLGSTKPIASAEFSKIIHALAGAKQRAEQSGSKVTGYAIVTNRKISAGNPSLRGSIEKAIGRELKRIEEASMSRWHDELMRFARRYGQRDEEIEAGRQRLLGLIFEATISGTTSGEITRDDLLKCLCNDSAACALTPKEQATKVQAQLHNFDVDVRLKPVRRERMATIDQDSAQRALVLFAGRGGSGKTAALHAWATDLTQPSNKGNPLVAIRAARGVSSDWLQELVRDWNPALQPSNADDAMQRLGIANAGAVPLIHLALDGADEYPDDSGMLQALQRIVTWFWKHDEAAAAGEPLRARLVVTCRDAEKFARDCLMLRRSGGSLGGGRAPLIITFDKFSESELRELLRDNFPSFESKLFRKAGDDDAVFEVQDTTSFPPPANAPRHPLVELLFDPVMWRSFCLVSNDIREKLARGEGDAERELVRHFCERFVEKVRIRTSFQPDTIQSVLITIAGRNQNLGRRYRTAGHWIDPACESGSLNRVEARRLLDEAASGGMIHKESDERWDWRSDAVEAHLASLFKP